MVLFSLIGNSDYWRSFCGLLVAILTNVVWSVRILLSTFDGRAGVVVFLGDPHVQAAADWGRIEIMLLLSGRLQLIRLGLFDNEDLWTWRS